MSQKMLILAVISLIIAGFVYTYAFSNLISSYRWDELALTREAIENYDTVIKWIEEGKYEEASVLAEATSAYLWYLRNAKDTSFYDRLSKRTGYYFFHYDIQWYCAKNVAPDVYVSPTKTCQEVIERIKEAQRGLCPKSDMTYETALRWQRECPDCSNLFDNVRCYEDGTMIQKTTLYINTTIEEND